MSWRAEIIAALDPTRSIEIEDELYLEIERDYREAAVLIPITDRPDPGVILTQRPDWLRSHAGQVAFPGGKIDAEDANAIAAALREAEEELAMPREHVNVLGAADIYHTGSGYRIVPVVGIIPPDLPLVRFDAMLMERVLVNLLENATKYAPPASLITVSAEADNNFLMAKISDTGPGLPAGQEDAIFEKFARGGFESSQPGVGLGLSICRAIVEAHGGAIHGETLPAGGACITFTIPLSEPPVVPEADDEANRQVTL